ncbi:MAG: efflux RND transporter periplasmic adaptor subunit, partial [Burkholderiales bacterium]
ERIQRFALGVNGESSVQHASGERKWLLLYAPLSLAYRVFVSALIVLWVGAHSVALGALAAIFVVIAICITPLWKLISRILAAAPVGPERFRARAMITSAAVGIGLLLFTIPLPSTTLARGVVWLPEQARIRAQTDGFVTQILAKDGAPVEQNEVLLVMDDPGLLVEQEVLIRKLAQYRADQYRVLLRDPARAQNFDQEIARVEGELRRIDERIEHLTIRAEMAGRLVMPRQSDLQGAFSRQGDTLGYVLASEEIGVRAALPERDAALVRETTRSISVRLADAPNAPVLAELVREIPAATHELPSAALGDRGGGPYVTDPADEDALRTLEPVVLVDLKLPEVALQRVGGRAWVRFSHGAEPLATQWYRRLRQLFLQHFNPTG